MEAKLRDDFGGLLGIGTRYGSGMMKGMDHTGGLATSDTNTRCGEKRKGRGKSGLSGGGKRGRWDGSNRTRHM